MYTAEELLGELEQCLNKIEFLHGCLTDPWFEYRYPERTVEHINRLQKIVGVRKYCSHSMVRPNCTSCEQGTRKRELARAVEAKF